MDKDAELEIFIESLILSIRISDAVKDRFFSVKFGHKIRALVFNYLKLHDSGKSSASEWGVLLERTISSIDDILGTAQDMAYLKLFQASPLFLQAKINLLQLKMQLEI